MKKRKKLKKKIRKIKKLKGWSRKMLLQGQKVTRGHAWIPGGAFKILNSPPGGAKIFKISPPGPAG